MKNTPRISNSIIINPEFYRLFLVYREVDVFGIKLKAPKKEAKELQQEIDSLYAYLKLSEDYTIEVKGNHTLLEVRIESIVEGNGKHYFLDFHLYTGRPIIDDEVPLKEKQKIKRVSIYDLRNDYDFKDIHKSSRDYYKVVRKMREILM